MEGAFYGIYALVFLVFRFSFLIFYQKTHSFATLTRSFFDAKKQMCVNTGPYARFLLT